MSTKGAIFTPYSIEFNIYISASALAWMSTMCIIVSILLSVSFKKPSYLLFCAIIATNSENK